MATLKLRRTTRDLENKFEDSPWPLEFLLYLFSCLILILGCIKPLLCSNFLKGFGRMLDMKLIFSC